MKAFLDGPRTDSIWQEKIKPILNCDYIIPDGDGWSPEDEKQLKEQCNVHVYIITPKMKGFHLIAQLMESAKIAEQCWRNPHYVVYCYLYEDGDAAFSRQQIRSLNLVGDMFKANNDRCIICKDLKEIANLLNTLNN